MGSSEVEQQVTIMNFKRLSFVFLIAFISQVALVAKAGLKEITPSKETAPIEVIFETTMGSFTLELYPEKAPKTVANFLTYVDEGFYKKTIFHRVIPRFVIQGGGFEKGMKKKPTHAPVRNESDNGLLNLRGTISMARTRAPHSATSQFFINAQQNMSLDQKGNKPGYTVFGKVTEGMDVIDKIASTPTHKVDRFRDVPTEDVVILSAKRKGGEDTKMSRLRKGLITAGEHYIVLDKPVATRDSSKIEILELFSYACSRCYEFEPLIKSWGKQQKRDVDIWYAPATWNSTMKFLAQVFYTANKLNASEIIHHPFFTAIVIEHQKLSTESGIAEFFTRYGIKKEAFTEAYNSETVKKQVKEAEARVRYYKTATVPEVIVNGKYRVDRMRAGGFKEMLEVVDFLINKERAILKK